MLTVMWILYTCCHGFPPGMPDKSYLHPFHGYPTVGACEQDRPLIEGYIRGLGNDVVISRCIQDKTPD